MLTVIYLKAYSILTTATAPDASNSIGLSTVKYAMLTVRYTTATSGTPIMIARGKFLQKEKKKEIVIFKQGINKNE